MADAIIEPGRNAWVREPAARAAVLVDCDDYFRALAGALYQAERSVFIIGWDIDSRAPVLRGHPNPDGLPTTLGPLLDALVRRRPGLDVYVLCWDYSTVYWFEREALVRLTLGAATHRRVHFELDDDHPPFGAHHQKLVVVDDALAFAGGIDLADRRWDTSRHAPDDPERRDFDGRSYPPYHDVHMVFDGEAARAAAELAHLRWRRATGQNIAPASIARDPWPPGLEPDFTDLPLALARTDPAYLGRPAVREVEALFLDGIAAAERSIYVENQYFTSKRVCDALCRRLEAAEGPEVVVVGPAHCSGWLETQVLGELRGEVLRRLRAADRHGRLRLVSPEVADGQSVFVHAKVMIVDDRLLHMGSANLTSRSLGVDTECDVAIEAADRRVAGGIARVRARLLGEHLGLAPEEAAAESAAAGLVATVDRHADGARRLVPLEAPAPADRGHSPVEAIADPTEPIALADLGRRLVPAAAQARGRRAYVRLGLTLAAVVGLVLVWQLTPLRDWLDARRLVAWAEPLRHHPLAPLAALGVYAAASLVMCPINLLVLATVLVFGPFLGALVALAGVLLSSVQMWAIGRLVGAEGVRRLGGRRVLAVRRQLQRRGIVTMTLVRLVPVAPAPLVSLAAGAFDVKLGDFTVGTALGMAPGILGLALLGERLLAALVHPTPGKIAAALAVAGLLVAVVLGGRALLRRRRGR